jgi:hypothetical protein
MSGSEASAGGSKQLFLATVDRFAIRTGRLRDWVLQDRAEKERKALDRALQAVALAKPADLQAVAAAHIRLLDVYHDIGLNQARYSFHCALGGAGVGLAFFILASLFALLSSKTAVALIPAIGGIVVEVLAGFVFFLYGRTILQLDAFYQRLETLQRHLVANSLCEALTDEAKEKARTDLIRQVAQLPQGSG